MALLQQPLVVAQHVGVEGDEAVETEVPRGLAGVAGLRVVMRGHPPARHGVPEHLRRRHGVRGVCEGRAARRGAGRGVRRRGLRVQALEDRLPLPPAFLTPISLKAGTRFACALLFQLSALRPVHGR